MFEHKIAVITGAASGIGKALAFKCSKEKMNIVLADINEIALHELQEQLPEAYTLTIDVSQQADTKRLLQETLKRFGKVDFLFNNAGIVGPIGPVWAVPLTSLEKMFDINLMGMIHVLQAFVPQMLKQDNECHIVNTSAMSGLFTYPYLSAYQISKHAIVTLSECLYHDLAVKNSKIKVSVLCPGWVKTNIPSSLENSDPENPSVDLHWLIRYGKRIKNGMLPGELADITFEALKENKFYIYSHPEMQEPVRQRFEAILSENKPPVFEI